MLEKWKSMKSSLPKCNFDNIAEKKPKQKKTEKKKEYKKSKKKNIKEEEEEEEEDKKQKKKTTNEEENKNIKKVISKSGAVVDSVFPLSNDYHVVLDENNVFNGKYFSCTLNQSNLDYLKNIKFQKNILKNYNNKNITLNDKENLGQIGRKSTCKEKSKLYLSNIQSNKSNNIFQHQKSNDIKMNNIQTNLSINRNQINKGARAKSKSISKFYLSRNESDKNENNKGENPKLPISKNQLKKMKKQEEWKKIIGQDFNIHLLLEVNILDILLINH